MITCNDILALGTIFFSTVRMFVDRFVDGSSTFLAGGIVGCQTYGLGRCGDQLFDPSGRPLVCWQPPSVYVNYVSY